MVGRRDILKRGGAAMVAVGIGTGAVVTEAAASNGTSPDAPGSGDPKHVALIVLDRSGSMGPMQAAVTESINTYLEEQTDKQGLWIGLVQFDSMKSKEGNYCEPIFGFLPASATPRLGPNDYQPRGGTPLLAAVAEGINKLEQVIRPTDRALMIFQTDGGENESPPEITREVIRGLMKAKEAAGNWTFAFLGADIYAWGEGGSLGYSAGSTRAYRNTRGGTQDVYAAASAGTANWYATTGGGTGQSMTSAAANTNLDFFQGTSFVDPATVTITAPAPIYTGKKPWDSLTPEQQQRWIARNTKNGNPPTA